MKGKVNTYRERIIKEMLRLLENNEYEIPKLSNGHFNSINIEKDELKLLIAYYQGKEIEIK